MTFTIAQVVMYSFLLRLYAVFTCIWQTEMEGLLNKYTNVMKGWQYRWFVMDADSGMLEYFEVSLYMKNL